MPRIICNYLELAPLVLVYWVISMYLAYTIPATPFRMAATSNELPVYELTTYDTIWTLSGIFVIVSLASYAVTDIE